MPIDLATESDLPRLCELLGILFTQEAEFSPNPALQTAALRAIISSPETGQILVARENGKIIGMVSLLYNISTYLGGRVALLEDLIVDPTRRGEGHGRELLRRAIEHAKNSKCLRLTLLTDRDNTPAQKFYESFGFHPSTMQPYRLHLPLDTK